MRKIINLGCKLNQYEGNALLRKFSDHKNLVIINTCCVTKEAEIKSLRKFRTALKQYSDHHIIATGCTCRLYPKKFKGADQIIDNIARLSYIKDVYPEPKRTRYFLKIQDGCSENCSYCIVAKVRDRVTSKEIDKIKTEINWAKEHGYQEIVLVGANIGLYRSSQGQGLRHLITTLTKIPDIPRIRLSSIEPKFINEELITALRDLRFCRHFHIPIQSADDHVLELMQRSYDAVYLEKAITLIAKNFDDVAIGADVIVGFPNEDDKAFSRTLTFIEKNPFTHLHVFPYSPRPLTSAFSMGDRIVRSVKKQRLWQLQEAIKEKNYRFRKNLLNKNIEVVVEQNKKKLVGLSDNYIRVMLDPGCLNQKKTIIKITEVLPEQTLGTSIK